jgi:hypothetical protein
MYRRRLFCTLNGAVGFSIVQEKGCMGGVEWGGRGGGFRCVMLLYVPVPPFSAHNNLGLFNSYTHRLNMELDLLSSCGLLCTAVLIGWEPTTPSLPPHLGLYTRALLVSQDRRQLFVTPWLYNLHRTHIYSEVRIDVEPTFY